MADDRAAPRYGELAPEGWVWSPPNDPDASEPDTDVAGTGTGDSSKTAPSLKAEPHATADEGTSGKPYRIADATFSVFLLVMAVMLSSSSVPALFGLRGTIDMFYADRGLGEYGGGSAVDIAGAVAAIVQLVLLAAAVWLTARLIGQRRRSWPVPLLLGALALIVTFGCLVLALIADPGLLTSLSAN